LQKVIENANNQIKQAREQLQKDKSNYNLGQVTMELKMIPSPEGVGMIFPTAEQLATMPDLSRVNIDFSPQESKPKSPAEIPVPDVKGYTELLARRKLSEAGFVMEINYQAVKVELDKPNDEGRVVNQFPRAKASAPPYSKVLVFIGK
jgi:hypothetical protein